MSHNDQGTETDAETDAKTDAETDAETNAETDAGTPTRPGADMRVHAALIFAQVALASLHVEGKLVMGPDHGVSPYALAMARIAGGALFFIPLYLATRSPDRESLSRRDVALLVTLSILGIVLNQVLYLAGLNLTSPISATLLVALIPVFTALIVAVTGRGRLRMPQVLGIAIAFLGTAVLIGFALPRIGDSLVLLNALAFASYVVFSKDIVGRIGTIRLMAWVFGVAALLFAPIGAVRFVAEAPTWSAPTIGLVAFVVLVPTILFYAVNAWALKRSTPGLVTIYMYLQPLVVVLLAWAQFGYEPSIRIVLAAVLTMAGVTIVIVRR